MALAPEHVYIKRVGDASFADETFAMLETGGVPTFGFLAEAACRKFEWGPSTRARIFLVAAAGAVEPSEEAIAAITADDANRLRVNTSLAVADIRTGSLLVARMASAGAAAAGGASSSLTPPSAASPSSQRSNDSPTVSGLVKERSDSAEAVASVAMFRLVHGAFPAAFAFDACKDKLFDSATMRITNRKFVQSADGFVEGRDAFVAASLDTLPDTRAVAQLPASSRIDFSQKGEYSSRIYTTLEFDCIMKLPVVEGCSEWTRDATGGVDAVAEPFFILSQSEQELPPRPAPPTPAVRLPASSRNTSFSAHYYPPGSSAYVVAEVYAPLEGKGSSTSQKLLQAERLLQYLKAKERVGSVRDCVLGFIFIGPKMDTDEAARLAKVLACYSSILPCLTELQRGPCRLLGFQTSFQPALATFDISLALEKLSAQQEKFGAQQEKLSAQVQELMQKKQRCTIQ